MARTQIERHGGDWSAGYARICMPWVVATVDRLQAPRAGEKGRGRVILCRGADRRAGGRVEVRAMARPVRQVNDEPVKLVTYTCPKCKRAMEEVDGRRMWCILCRVRMVAERRRRDGQE
jgi:hypothetical protein